MWVPDSSSAIIQTPHASTRTDKCCLSVSVHAHHAAQLLCETDTRHLVACARRVSGISLHHSHKKLKASRLQSIFFVAFVMCLASQRSVIVVVCDGCVTNLFSPSHRSYVRTGIRWGLVTPDENGLSEYPTFYPSIYSLNPFDFV